MAAAEQYECSVMHGKHWTERPMLDGDLDNFRDNGLSNGLDGTTKRRNQDPGGKDSHQSITGFFIMYRSIVGHEFMERHYPKHVVGNPPGPMCNGRVLTVTDIFAVYNAWQIARFSESPQRIVEIGPGFGALASIMRQLYPDAELVLVDLPEHRNLLTFYLEQTVGMEGITITTELPDGADLVIAQRCLMEMPDNQLHHYIDWVQACDVDLFYITTRYIKHNALKRYPFDKKWTPVISQNDYVTGQLHELLLKRTKEDSDLLGMQLECLPPFVSEDFLMWFKGNPHIQAIGE
jgi:hypothetical protein